METALADRLGSEPREQVGPAGGGPGAFRLLAAAVVPVWACWVAAVGAVLVVADALGAFPRPATGRPGVLAPLAGWDAGWYEAIARHGYGSLGGREFAFFPLWPAILRLVPAGHRATLGLAVALVASLAVFMAVAALAPRASPRTVAVALAVWPGSFVLLLAYPDGLVVALAAAACLLVRGGSPLPAGLVAAIGALLRPTGAIVAVPLALTAPGGVRARCAAALPPLLAAAAVLGYLWHESGDALAFSHAQARWGRHWPSLGPWPGRAAHGLGEHPLLAVIGALVLVALVATARRRRQRWPLVVGYGLVVGAATAGAGTASGAVALPMLLLVFVPGLVLLARDARGRPWLAYAALVLGASVGSGTIEGLGRQTLLAFPLVWALAEGPRVLRRRPVVAALGVVNAALVLTLTHFAP